jgi:hypothetical protein
VNLFKLLSAHRAPRVELRPIKHLTTDLRRPRDAKRFALKCKPLQSRPHLPAFLRRQAD